MFRNTAASTRFWRPTEAQTSISIPRCRLFPHCWLLPVDSRMPVQHWLPISPRECGHCLIACSILTMVIAGLPSG